MRELASGSCSWLRFMAAQPTPQYHSPKWASAEWRLLLLWRLVCPLGLPQASVASNACQDAYGALTCAVMGMHKRHNTIRDAFADLATAVGLQCRTSVGKLQQITTIKMVDFR